MNRIGKIQEFLKVTPNDNFMRHALALEYIKAGDDARARDEFEAILTASPDYIGSYYHLAKLLNAMMKPILQFNGIKGMNAALDRGDNHAYNELRAAYEELIY